MPPIDSGKYLPTNAAVGATLAPLSHRAKRRALLVALQDSAPTIRKTMDINLQELTDV